MRFLLLILLVFPILEIWLLMKLANQYGWWVLVYVILMAMLGWRLIQEEKQFFLSRTMQGMMQGGAPMVALAGGAKNLLAGVLLIIPGVVTDFIAVILLLIPSSRPRSDIFHDGTNHVANDDVIEGEYRRED